MSLGCFKMDRRMAVGVTFGPNGGSKAIDDQRAEASATCCGVSLAGSRVLPWFGLVRLGARPCLGPRALVWSPLLRRGLWGEPGGLLIFCGGGG